MTAPTDVATPWGELRTQSREPLVVVSAALVLGLLLWGPQGQTVLPPSWLPADPRLSWMVRFAFGATVMVVLPLASLRLWAQPSDPEERDLAAWGFGLGDWRLGLPLALGLTVLGSALMVLGASKNPGLEAEYPLFAPGPGAPPLPAGAWVSYEATYLLFFLCGEAAFRGLLLFGLRRRIGAAAAVLLTTALQVVWHLDKPGAELATAPLWGLAAGALNLRLRSFWWLLLAHWATNVTLDFAIHYSR